MSGIPEFPLAFALLVLGILIPFLPRLVRQVLTVLVPLSLLGILLQMDTDTRLTTSFAGFELVLFQISEVNFVFGVIFLLISAIASIYALHIQDAGQQAASVFYAAGAIGVTFAGDFLTLLIFWELMAVASAWLIFARQRAESTRAGFRYLLFHFFGGSVLFGGIILLYGQTGSLELMALNPDQGLAAWLILIGVVVNVALPPLHPWLPDAYPRATITGAIFMSALTTKSAVYVLMVLFPGWSLLIYGGVFMTLYGVFYAVLANDIRQILAYHIISQVGYMVTGVGIGTPLALNGTAAHAYSHILYKALLFMGAGAVIQATGKSKLTELGGLAPKLRVVMILFMIGAFSISGFPLFNGFTSKSIIVSSAGKAHLEVVMLLLLLASIGTFLSIGLKIPVFTFWGEDRKLEVKKLPWNMYVAMGTLAFLCTFYGILPQFLYQILPFEMKYHPYTAYHLIEATQLLIFTFIAFWMLRSMLAGKPYIALDTDWFYRRLSGPTVRLVIDPINAVFAFGAVCRGRVVEWVSQRFSNPQEWFQLKSGSGARFDADAERGSLGGLIAIVLLLAVLFAGSALFF